MKEQPRKTQIQINEEEIGKLPEKEFRIIIVKVIQNLKNRMEKMPELTNKDLEEIKKKKISIQKQATQLLKFKIL